VILEESCRVKSALCGFECGDPIPSQCHHSGLPVAGG
jgi:hypothetical protein